MAQKTLLLIRSVGLQQVDTNLIAIRKRYPEHRILMLTHAHAMSWAAKYEGLDEVICYPYTAGFSPRRTCLHGRRFDVVVVPVGNLSGAGFHNVFSFAVTLKAKSYVSCNLVSEFRTFTPAEMWFRGFLLGLFWVASMLGSFLALPVVFCLLPLILLALRRKA